MGNGEEKKRRLVNACAAVLSFVTVFVLSRLLAWGVSALPGVGGPSMPAGVSAALWAVSLGVGCVMALAVVRPRRTAEEEFPEDVPPHRPKKPAYLIPAAVFLLLAVNILISLSGLGQGKTPSYSVRELTVRAILGCTVYPILEEIFFRGILLGALRESDDPLAARLAAAIITAAAFAAVHTDGGFLFPFAAGIILAVTAPYGLSGNRRSLVPVPSILAHALYNLSLYVSLAMMMTGFEPVITLSVFAGAAAVTAGIMILTGGKTDGKRRKNKENNG